MTLVKFNNHPAARNYNSIFNGLLNDFPAIWEKDFTTSLPPVNITETADAYHIELNAPGRTKEDFKVNIEKGLLTISFEKKDEQKNTEVTSIRKEFSFQSFKRTFSLDEKVDVDNIQAKYENGLLKFNLPKKDQVKEAAKQISVQ